MVEGISDEEFEKMEDVGSAAKVFDNALEKVSKYNSYDKKYNNEKYNLAYRELLDAREGESCLVDENGNVEDRYLLIIEKTLLDFDMGRQMDEKFKDRLKRKLSKPETKTALKKFRKCSILSSAIEEIESETKDFFSSLSAKGEECLSSRDDSFNVGATKIMNFLFPELFVMADRWVKKGIRKSGPLNPVKYWSIMLLCHEQLMGHEDWQGLLDLDQKPTTLTRIFDKCAFVMGKFERHLK